LPCSAPLAVSVQAVKGQRRCLGSEAACLHASTT
jgi:hypothetical protein